MNLSTVPSCSKITSVRREKKDVAELLEFLGAEESSGAGELSRDQAGRAALAILVLARPSPWRNSSIGTSSPAGITVPDGGHPCVPT